MTGAWWVDIVYVDKKTSIARTTVKGPYSSIENARRNANSVRAFWSDVDHANVRWTSETSTKEYDHPDSWCGR